MIKALIMMMLLWVAAPSNIFSQESKDKVVKDTTIKSKSYSIYEGKRGGRYILRTSAAGKVYKQYLKKK